MTNTYHVIIGDHPDLLAGQYYVAISYHTEHGIVTDIALQERDWLEYRHKGILIKNLSIDTADICALVLLGDILTVPDTCVDIFNPFGWEIYE